MVSVRAVYHEGHLQLLDPVNRFLAWQHAAQGKETRLHDRVDPVAKLALSRHAVGVDCIHLQPLLDNYFLH